MRAGTTPKSEAPPVVMQVTGMSSDKNQPTPHVTFDSPNHETPHELVKVQDMLTEMSKTMAEQSKTMTEQTKLGQQALAELKDQQGAAATCCPSTRKI